MTTNLQIYLTEEVLLLIIPSFDIPSLVLLGIQAGILFFYTFAR